MSKQAELNSKLKYALENQIGWQKYAESKNLILFTLTGATLLTIFGKLEDDIARCDFTKNCSSFAWNYKFFIVTTIVSFTISVYSFLILKYSNKKEKGYLIPWVSVYNKKLQKLKEIADDYSEERHTEDILHQHQVGSKHTLKKYILFDVGVMVYFLGIILLVFPLVAAFF